MYHCSKETHKTMILELAPIDAMIIPFHFIPCSSSNFLTIEKLKVVD